MVQVLPERQSFRSQLAQGIGSSLSQGMQMAMKMAMEKEKQENLIKTLTSSGVSPEDAELYSKLTTGGQTVLAKDVLENRRRGIGELGQRSSSSADKITNAMESEPDSGEQEVESNLKMYQEDQDYGLTPSEKVKRQSERFKANLPVYQEAGTKLRGMTRDKERIGILEGLEKSNKLPKNFGRLNVDNEGNLRFPFASSPEAERYVKTLNEYSIGAKDSFGARVTNFDLQQFLLRFPTLLNSSEGRKQLYQQMKIVNEINSLYYKNLKHVYDRAGGIRNIDPDVAEQMAEKLSEEKIQGLVKKFDEIGTFSTLPDPGSFKGKRMIDEKTGEKFQSDGENWNPIEQSG